jgi:glycolate oxidase iron-sulfur subunit
MQTNFSLHQLADPDIAHTESILRKCVHCGFCTATCPTYVELGDELDSPRGRIYLIKQMIEGGEPAKKETVKHIDRCLSCLSCMSTCPSGVNYMHLVDHARAYIDKSYKRPLLDRLIRQMLMFVLPEPKRFKFALRASILAKPFAGVFRQIPGLRPMAAMLDLAPRAIPASTPTCSPGVFPAAGGQKKRVALMTGCAQPVLNPGINEASVEVLNRIGTEVVVPSGMGCCGALTHHMGKEEDARARARTNVDAWISEMDGAGLDAIIINTSGCGTTVKNYAHMLGHDAAYKDKAARVVAITRDISEYLAETGLENANAPEKLKVAYHSACSLQHGQCVKTEPKQLLQMAGFEVVEPAEGHLCCGSAGTYNILQPEIAGRLQKRKVKNIEATKPDVIAAGNIGCMTQIGVATGIPVVHMVELLNWACGGEKPSALES